MIKFSINLPKKSSKRNRKCTFEKIKQYDTKNYLQYYALSDNSTQEIILRYCLDKDIEIKTIQVNYCDCKVILKCTKDELYEFVIYLLKEYGDCFKNFKF